MSSEMQNAIHAVEASCSTDLAVLCPSPQDQFDMRAPVMRLGAPRDPLIEFLNNPQAPLPMKMDISNILDEMMSHAILMANDEPQFTVVHFISFADEEPSPEEGPTTPEEESTIRHEKTAPEEVLVPMVQNLVQRTTEDPETVTNKIIQHANDLLKTEQDDDRVRMARRLTQMAPEMVNVPRLPLPFGCPRNRCLMSAFEQGAVSPPCSEALKTAERLQSATIMREFVKVERDSRLFLSFTLLYGVLAFVTLAVLSKHLRKMRRSIEYQVNLKKSILQAVYSNPAIKAKVEESMGREIGYVPPLPPHVLAELGGHQFPHRGFFFSKLIMLFTFALVFTLVFINPLLAMPILCILMFARFLRLACCPPQNPVPMCTCCCCGLSTDDVKNGNVSATQACCTCCNSMGVCAPGCADCCGLEPDGACDCCMDECSCCDPPTVHSSCGALTDAQANSSCCSGEVSKTCCGDGASPACTKPLLHAADKGIYQGIPIQIV